MGRTRRELLASLDSREYSELLALDRLHPIEWSDDLLSDIAAHTFAAAGGKPQQGQFEPLIRREQDGEGDAARNLSMMRAAATVSTRTR